MKIQIIIYHLFGIFKQQLQNISRVVFMEKRVDNTEVYEVVNELS